MFGVAAKLLMANAFKLEQGEIQIFNIPVVMMPADAQVHLLKNSIDKLGVQEGTELLYNSAKVGTKQYCVELLRNTNARGAELSKLYSDIVTLAGYGVASLVKFDYPNKIVVCRFTNSPIAKRYNLLIGKSKYPVDAITLGLFAGSFGVLFNTDFDAIEVKCVAMGDQYCEFVFAPPEEIEKIKLAMNTAKKGV